MFKDAGNGSRSFKILLCFFIITALTLSSFGLGCSMLPLKSPVAPKENSKNKDSEKPKPPEELASMLNSEQHNPNPLEQQDDEESSRAA